MDYVDKPIVVSNLMQQIGRCRARRVDMSPFGPDAKGFFGPSAEGDGFNHGRCDDSMTQVSAEIHIHTAVVWGYTHSLPVKQPQVTGFKLSSSAAWKSPLPLQAKYVTWSSLSSLARSRVQSSREQKNSTKGCHTHQQSWIQTKSFMGCIPSGRQTHQVDPSQRFRGRCGSRSHQAEKRLSTNPSESNQSTHS